MPKNFSKDPDAVKDYQINWIDWLQGDTISTSTWMLPQGETDLHISSPAASNTETTATVWLSGGKVGTVVEVTNRITTTGGRTEDDSIIVQIKEQ